MPILQEDENAALYDKAVTCAVCPTKLKNRCVREVRVELTLSEESGGGMAPDVVMNEPDGKSMLFCSQACARYAAKMVASEIQNPVLRDAEGHEDPKGDYTFPSHLSFRGKVEKWDIHFTNIGPATYSEGQDSRGGI